MKRTYEVRDRADKRAIREFLKREGQFLLPMLELVEQTEVVIDEVIQVMGRATIEAVLEMSAEGVAGVKQAGRSRAEDDTVWYGRQGGVVYLSDRKVRVGRPRLRRRGAGEGGEVEVPAYAAMRRPGAVADRMLEVLMAGVSTRKYGRVIGEMADTVGVSKSAVSRETVEASERVLKELMDAKQGEQKLEQLARWLERDHPSASASLREGLSEMFTINRLGLPPRLRKCLGSTNLIDSTHSGVRQKTRRVTNWKNGAMALRWAAASFVETEKSYRRIIGYSSGCSGPTSTTRTGCRNEKGRLTRRLSGATTFNCQRDTIPSSIPITLSRLPARCK